MPNEFEMCVIDLSAKGIEKDKAIRACVIAGYSKSRKMKSGSVSDVAAQIAAESSKFSAGRSGPAPLNQSQAEFAINSPSFELSPQLKDPIYPFPNQPQVPVLMRECLMVRVGTFNGLEITSQAIDEFVKNFTQPIPVIYDHEEKVRDGYNGWVLAMRRDGDKLIGLCEFIGEDVVEKIQTRRLKKTSIGFCYGELWKIFEYSFVVRPAVDDSGIIPIESPSLSYSASPADPLEHTSPLTISPKISLSSAEEPGKEKQDMPLPPKSEPAPVQELSVPKAEVQPETAPAKSESFSADQVALLKQIEAQQTQFALQMQQLSEQNQKLQAANDELQLAAKKKSNADLWLTFAASGQSLPVCKDEELDLISTFSEDQLAKYKSFKAKQGSLIDYARLSTPSTPSGEKSKLDKNSPEYLAQKAEFESISKKEFGVAFKKKEGKA